MIMKIIDLVAILGALAWLPQIISWIYHWLQKPMISVYHEEEAEVGFIKFGNAFNIRLSFLARRKHALIDNIELCITDKDGANHTFKWIWYSETLYELQAPTGNATMAKQQNAIAINAYKDVLIEKFIGFQSSSFLDRRKQLAYKLNSFIENQSTVGKIDADAIRRSNEYNELLRLYKNSMIWKTGDYSAICKIHIADTDTYMQHSFKFRLSDIEVETLKKNIEFARKIIDVEFINPQQQIEGTWLWTKPSIDI